MLIKHRTTRRDEIWHFIGEYAVDHHNAPSTLEIARVFGIAQQTVYHHMMHLISEGKLCQVDGKWKLVNAEYIPPPDN